MFANRAVGHPRAPTREEVADYAARHRIVATSDELDVMQEVLIGSIDGYARIEALDAPAVEQRHHYRDPGRPPRQGEDPFNAFIRFCEVRGAADGPLAGKTVGVKDCIAVAGVPMTNGGRRQPVTIPMEDAVVVERLLDAGAMITGKTNLEDLALGFGEGSAFGAARNPVDPKYSTGGSSSGSAAAVAAGMVDIALGADEGGSVRIPAAWCGLVGMKATHGLVPSHGLSYMDHTLDHIGPITKTVADNALVLEVIAGHDWRDPQWVRAMPEPGEYRAAAGRGVAGLRFGVVKEALEPSGCTPDVLGAFEESLALISRLGGKIVDDVSIPLWVETPAIGGWILTLGLYGMAITNGVGFGHLGRIDQAVTATWAAQRALQPNDLPPWLKSRLVAAEYALERYQGIPFVLAQNLRIELRRQIVDALQTADLLVTPTTNCVAVELLDRRATPKEMNEHTAITGRGLRNTMQLDLSGHPALSIPGGVGANGLPVGLQIIGPHFAEELCYQAGFALEAATS